MSGPDTEWMRAYTLTVARTADRLDTIHDDYVNDRIELDELERRVAAVLPLEPAKWA